MSGVALEDSKIRHAGQITGCEAFSGRRGVAMARLSASRPFQTADAPRLPIGDV
jgi:hypothetical protein